MDTNSEKVADLNTKRPSETRKRFEGWRRFAGLNAGDSSGLSTDPLRELCLSQASKLAVVTHQLSNLLFQIRHAPDL